MNVALLHQEFILHLESVVADTADRGDVERALDDFLADRHASHLHQDILNRMYGYFGITPLLADPHTTEIMINGTKEVFVERFGRIEKTDVVFESDAEIVELVNRLANTVGRRVDEASPLVDFRLPDGSRLNAIIPPLSRSGSVVTIRKFSTAIDSMEQMVAAKSFDRAIADFFVTAVRERQTILISGATGSGKTTLLNVLAGAIPAGERVITVEDTAEIQLSRQNAISLEVRQPNIEGAGGINIRTLLRNALRMRPDRILVGEVRGGEAFDMLQAMHTGHTGSMTTLHANSPRDALGRLVTLALMANVGLPEKALREQVETAIDIVVQTERLPSGERKIVSVERVVPGKGEFVTQTIFRYDRAISAFVRCTS